MRSPGHRNRTLADLEQIVIPALATRQFTVARRIVDDKVVPVGLIIWASVSPAIDAQLASSLDKPVALKPADWTSGENVWLVDAAGEARIVAAMINDACATKIKRSMKVRAKDKDGTFKVRIVEPGAVTAAKPAPAGTQPS